MTISTREHLAIVRYLSGTLGNRKPITMAAAAETAGRSASWMSNHFRMHKLPTLPQGWGKRRARK